MIRHIDSVDNAHTVLIAGGGTGGHVFPALAVADRLTQLAPVRVVFVGSPRGLEATVVEPRGYALELLKVAPLKNQGVAGVARGVWTAAEATRSAFALLRRYRPRVVLSVGGYAAGPAALAGVMAKIPLAVFEPNCVVGLANRWLSPFAKAAYVAWPEAAQSFRSSIAKTYGVALRSGFEPSPYMPRVGKRRVLVLGGSQGARALNERVPEALGRVSARLGRIDVLHQSGRGQAESVRQAYARAGMLHDHVSVAEFVDDVPGEMAAADVIIARAGAVTLAEIAAIGRASLLIPFPHAADDHQAKNAMALARQKGALCIRQEAADPVRLATELELLFSDDELRTAMAEQARRVGRPNAADAIARDLLALAGLAVTHNVGRDVASSWKAAG